MGIFTQEDEFEGTSLCGKQIRMTRHAFDLSVLLFKETPGSLGLAVQRSNMDWDDVVFNTFGPLRGDEMLFLFADGEVVRFDLADTFAELDDHGFVEEWSFVATDPLFLEDLVTVDEDVRFRLSPENDFNYDDTVPADFLNEFSEFLEECL